MSENGETSQTATSTEQTTECSTDLNCIEQCNELINQHRLGHSGKAITILDIRESLLQSPAVRSGRNINEALDVFIGMLDSINASRAQASEQGHQSSGTFEEEETHREDRGSDNVEETEVGRKQTRVVTDSEDEDEPSSKQAKTDIRETYQQLENFATDPKGVVNDILSTPGCPPFPPSEWLNIVHWKYVDLAKVLDSAHMTELDPKKTHVIDNKIELALRVLKSSAGIKTSSDHNIAFSMYIEAISFVFPQ
ncbi:hypothetical protein DFJ58DRAFT_837078 [Suillus subalutaceus]|uniref:uncharacterized protein n=1 Tax=Suillus subalutaceus TaxID=48586 RepID=UPI001B879B29|nr:uncharacterized protein DFJ58DRAFT_837078 [Suillus subalutaceus]KAG1871758.1 hypothetical protein DFJ58DRAFT_837078 [Suillus subalutaceus]